MPAKSTFVTALKIFEIASTYGWSAGVWESSSFNKITSMISPKIAIPVVLAVMSSEKAFKP